MRALRGSRAPVRSPGRAARVGCATSPSLDSAPVRSHTVAMQQWFELIPESSDDSQRIKDAAGWGFVNLHTRGFAGLQQRAREYDSVVGTIDCVDEETRAIVVRLDETVLVPHSLVGPGTQLSIGVGRERMRGSVRVVRRWETPYARQVPLADLDDYVEFGELRLLDAAEHRRLTLGLPANMDDKLEVLLVQDQVQFRRVWSVPSWNAPPAAVVVLAAEPDGLHWATPYTPKTPPDQTFAHWFSASAIDAHLDRFCDEGRRLFADDA